MKYLVLVLILTISMLFSIDLEEKIKISYDSGYYQRVIDLTERLDNTLQNYDELIMFRGVCFYEVGEYRKSRRILLELLDKTPYFNQKDITLYYIALSELKLLNTTTATNIFVNLLNSTNNKLAKNSKEILHAVIKLLLSDDDYLELSDKIVNKEILKELAAAGNSIKILVVLPLTGEDKDVGNDILRGIRYAVEKIKLKNGKSVKLDVINSESSITTMVKKVTERLKSSRYNLIIGELRSNATSALAGIASVKKIPLVSPTASMRDISSISQNIFQLNTTSYTLSRKMAEYAVDSLNYKTFGILAPLNSDGKESVAGFTDVILEKGCGIIGTEWYYDASNLSKQLLRFRENICLIDSLDVEKYMSDDSIKTVPVGVIDAFFLPVQNNDVQSVLPQMTFYNFKGHFLGTYGWDDNKTLTKLAENADSLIFIKESSYNVNNPKYNDFAYKFRNDKKRNPKRMEINGYSVMEMIMNLLNENSKLSLQRILSTTEEYNAINGKVLFDDKRSNLASDLFTFLRRKGIKKLSFSDKKAENIFAEPERYYNLGYVYSVKHDDSLAVKNFLTSLNKYEDINSKADVGFVPKEIFIDLYEKIADSFYNFYSYRNAVAFYDTLLVDDPENVEIKFQKARSVAKYDKEKALELFKELSSQPLYYSESLLETGIIYYSRKDEDGEYIAKDRKKGLILYKRSAELGNERARKIIEKIERENNKDEHKEKIIDW
ncbi:MAG: ABC transporter substrate-binding protein [Candidatus Delongbacteria bacterium]|jgi:ABC-type branched-subunit amino acid transport system substrate-binding protein|nr:ABC transporter substrate-binding protein [Candidatus Delongbacteria bacterium]